MPCFMKGQIKLTDFEKLKKEADKLGLILIELDTGYINVWHNSNQIATINRNELMTGRDGLLRQVMKSYSISQIKMAAQKKGWKVKQSTNKKGELVLTVRE